MYSSRIIINEKKRKGHFLRHDQTVQMLCLEYITCDISSHLSDHLEHTDFPLQSAKHLDAVSPAVRNSSSGKEASHEMHSTWRRPLFQLEASRFFSGFIFLLSSSPAHKPKKKKRESQNNACIHGITFCKPTNYMRSRSEKKNRSSPFKNLGFKQVTNEQWMLNRIAMRALGCKLQGAVPMVVSINAAPGVIQPTGPLWLVCLGVSVT